MKLSAGRIRSINRAIAGGTFYSTNKALPSQVPNLTYTRVVFVPAFRA